MKFCKDCKYESHYGPGFSRCSNPRFLEEHPVNGTILRDALETRYDEKLCSMSAVGFEPKTEKKSWWERF